LPARLHHNVFNGFDPHQCRIAANCRNEIMKRLLLITLLGAIGIGVSLIYHGDLKRARNAAAKGGLIANTASGPIEYVERGPGIPLLSVHGAGGGFDQGLANAAGLLGEDFKVIAPSRFGYLRTPVPKDASPAAQADAHADLLTSLNTPKAIVMGISAGARSALELAVRHPDRVSALILIVPGTYSPASPVSIDQSRGNKLAFRLVNTGADFAWWATGRIAPSVLIRFVGVRPEIVTASPKAERDRVMNIVWSVEPLSRRFPGINIDSTSELTPLPLEAVHIPTLIISARDDLFNTLPAAEYAASKIPGAELIIYETGGHLLVGHQEEVRDAVRRFLARARLL
jgi:pimeloyl-ACP methyl ester carboxylesterase